MASLIKELDLPENQVLITILEATPWYLEMMEDNRAFNQQSEERSIAKNDDVDYDTQEVYKYVRIACEELFDAIEVLNCIASNEKNETRANFINKCNQKYLTVVRTRKTRTGNAMEVIGA
ncbi:hypothetical protein ALGA_4137 [Labilibaculum antarcticum]|uniref:Uncharacterized protein n=1 Tax=Labilibaculum antarcticum TaxID=1717717 RepID=A0A1Y1CPR4_9BACT|nr:hypothetical protein ALGA_4137 [Labilibaculum antarcticum]